MPFNSVRACPEDSKKLPLREQSSHKTVFAKVP